MTSDKRAYVLNDAWEIVEVLVRGSGPHYTDVVDKYGNSDRYYASHAFPTPSDVLNYMVEHGHTKFQRRACLRALSCTNLPEDIRESATNYLRRMEELHAYEKFVKEDHQRRLKQLRKDQVSLERRVKHFFKGQVRPYLSKETAND
jgi:hypothetical protein